MTGAIATGMDRPLAPAALGPLGWPRVVGDGPCAGSCIGWATSGSGPAMSCSPIRVPRAEDAAASASGSRTWAAGRPAASRTRPTCCCSRRCAPAGPTREIGEGRAQRPERAARPLRRDQRADGAPAVAARAQPDGPRISGQFLQLVHDHYRGWPVWLLLDEDSSHTAHGSVGLARELGIGLIWLPKRCPELNAMDHLWGHAKDEVCANHQAPSIEHLVDRFIRYIQGLSPEEARRKAGILSEEFWLREECQN